MEIARKTVLVTGADGFIGSHLVEMLARHGARVRALALYNSFNSSGWLEAIASPREVEIISGDVRDAHLVKRITKDADVVFHLAALIAIPYSYRAPDSYVHTNVIGTLNVVQAALENGARVVHTSTSEVYGTARRVPIDEGHPLQPQSPYSASKIAADAMALSFFHAFGLPLTVARPFNTYGPRQSARAVIPTIITQILAGKRAIKLGSLAPTRDFTYVEDTCRGIVALAQCDAAIGQAVNIGSNFEMSIGDTAALIAEIIGERIDITCDEARVRPQTSEVERLWCDNSRLAGLTGFRPQIGLREGLQRTIEWFRQPANLARYKADSYNV
jgi:NAD dependent epimerase/dehydratase